MRSARTSLAILKPVFKGVGEIGLVPTAGAVAAALYDYDGVWRSKLPMKRDDSSNED
jgi:CO/xanthine dehydrogenase Mo-binding subunit